MSALGVIGWDIGGVNTKVACVSGGRVLDARSHPFEIQRDPAALAPLLVQLAQAIGARPADAYGVTMTAELSQYFRTKREGVAFVLDALRSAFPAAHIRVYAVDGRWLDVDDARRDPVAVAASNWAATARLVAETYPEVILIDIGTTTTDIIPIVGGSVAARGWTDPARLREGELVYVGALRTPVEAIVSSICLDGAAIALSAEGFALAGDVYLWRGELLSADFTVPTPDGRPATREFAGERLARAVCADREMLDESQIDQIADGVAEAAVSRVATAVERVRARHPALETVVVTGLGDFVAARAAHRVGLRVTRLAASLGDAAARSAPAAAVALLLERSLRGTDRTR